MRSKLTKTIFIIVFVVFLGLIKTENVNAGDLSCYYYEEDKMAITITIPSGMGSATASKIEDIESGNQSTRSSIKILNWKKSDATSYKKNGHKYADAGTSFVDKNGDTVVYNGYDDVWLNEQCPRYLVVVNENWGAGFIDIDVKYTFLMFSDSANVSKIKNYLEDAVDDGLVSYTARSLALPLISSSGSRNDDSDVPSVTTRACECDNTSYNKKIHSNFTIGENNSLESPSVKGLFGSDSFSATVANWKRPTDSTTYTGLNDVSASDACPAYILYLNTGMFTDTVYFSDSANLTAIRSDAAKKHNFSTDDIYTVSCVEDVNTPSGSSDEFQKPEYENASVNDDIVLPLEPDTGTVSCGSGYITDIPVAVVRVTRLIYIIIQIIVPIALVILGSLDLMKAVSAQKDDEIKAGQKVFVKRLIAAIIIFFVFAIIKLIVGIVSQEDANIINCMDCFLNGTDNCD